MTTIADVARRAGVSPVTVSRVINGAANVSPATREKVEQAIDDLHYLPNIAARSLRSKRTNALALVVPDITNSFWTTIARGVEDTARKGGYSVLLCNTDEDPTKQLDYLNVVLSRRVDGVIIAPYDSDACNLSKLRERNIPTVIIDRRISGWEVDSVTSDSVAGACALIRHLLSLGHSRIGIISGPVSTSTAEDRVAGYRLALTEAGLPVDENLIKHGEFKVKSGEQLTYQLLDAGLSPTAIFAGNNLIAVGAMEALKQRGLRVPQDIALVTFDDLSEVSRVFPFFTVIAQPAYAMGAKAADLLLGRLGADATIKPRQVVMPGKLIVRYSCGSQTLVQPTDHLFSQSGGK